MSTRLARAVLFLSSYAPLALIFAGLFWQTHPAAAAANLGVAALSLLGLAIFFLGAHRLAPRQSKVATVRGRDDQVMSYVMSYLVGFLSVAFSDTRHLIALAAFFLLLAYIYVNANVIHVNPVLNLLGYHLYEVTLADGETYSLIARGRVRRGATLSFATIGDDILLQKRP
jgi:hypothetical protein